MSEKNAASEPAHAVLLRHYAKALLFKSEATAPDGAPALAVGVDLQTARAGEDSYELELRLRIQATAEQRPLLLLELAYAGLFRLRDIAQDGLPRFLLIDAPQILFPFARQVAADAIRGGGFPPLTIETIDFAELYRQKKGAVPAPIEGLLLSPPAALIRELFATQLYNAPLGATLEAELEAACLALAQNDSAGQDWCKANAYRGYTSYATVRDLPRRAPVFAELVRHVDRHVAAFAAAAQFDMQGRRLVLDGIWINVMEEGAMHAAHIHPHSAVSGTYYVTVPEGAAAICFEDPRAGLMMSARPRAPDARSEAKAFLSVKPKAGSVLLWESWLRHGVEMQGGGAPRISISFNYRLEVTEGV